VWIKLFCLEIGSSGTTCKHSTEIAGSLKVRAFIDQLSDCKRFSKLSQVFKLIVQAVSL
jgi:hypothetical protein